MSARAKRVRAAAAVALALLTGQAAGAPREAPAGQAAYTPDGRLQLPQGYREWIFLTSGIDMSYSAGGTPAHSMFDNIFVPPGAYQSFQATGTWPDGTVLLMEVRGAGSKGSINQRGHFQTGDLMGIEVHVKDTRRFKEGWAFFTFDGSGPAAPIPPDRDCHTCHAEHAAVDTTFVQFYPTLLPVARMHGTVKPGTDLKDADGPPAR